MSGSNSTGHCGGAVVTAAGGAAGASVRLQVQSGIHWELQQCDSSDLRRFDMCSCVVTVAAAAREGELQVVAASEDAVMTQQVMAAAVSRRCSRAAGGAAVRAAVAAADDQWQLQVVQQCRCRGSCRSSSVQEAAAMSEQRAGAAAGGEAA